MADLFVNVNVPEGESMVNASDIVAFLRGNQEADTPSRHRLIMSTGLELFVLEDYDEVAKRIRAAVSLTN